MVAEKHKVWRRFGQNIDNPLDGGQKTHVQHTVGFVEHQDLDIPQVNQFAADEILQASGRGDYQSCTNADTLNLRFLINAADYQRRFGRGLAAQASYCS